MVSLNVAGIRGQRQLITLPLLSVVRNDYRDHSITGLASLECKLRQRLFVINDYDILPRVEPTNLRICQLLSTAGQADLKFTYARKIVRYRDETFRFRPIFQTFALNYFAIFRSS